METGLFVEYNTMNLFLDYTNEEIGEVFLAAIAYIAGGQIPNFEDHGMKTLFRVLTDYSGPWEQVK